MLFSKPKPFDVATGLYHLGTAAAEQFVLADPRFARAPAQPSGAGYSPDP